MPSSAVLAQMLVGNLKITIFHKFTPIFSLNFMSFNADFQYKSIACKIIANYGELTEIQHEECASTHRTARSADFGKKNMFGP